MSDMLHPATLPTEQLLQQCDVRRQRRSGPGGQHRNKVETAVVLTHRPTACVGEATERRSQEQNRQVAIQRLRIELALAVRCEHLEPSALWRTRLAGTRLSVSVEHPDFPALLAEALDGLESCQWRLDVASQRQGCSSSQLVKLLKLEHRALGQLNAARRELGLRELK